MVKRIDDAELENKVLNAERPLIIDFWNEGCGPCKMLAPILEEISSEREDIDIYSAKIAESEKLVEYFSVMAAPTLLFILNGQVQKKTLGFKSKESILTIIDRSFRGEQDA